jgi:hypothetical protein
MLQRHHDGADHGHEQNEPGRLEEVNVAGIEHEPDRLRVADVLRRRSGTPGTWINRPTADHEQKFGQEHRAHQRANRQIAEKAFAQLGEIDIQHHHHEQEQHRHRADVDHN